MSRGGNIQGGTYLQNQNYLVAESPNVRFKIKWMGVKFPQIITTITMKKSSIKELVKVTYNDSQHQNIANPVARADMFLSFMCCIIMINTNPLYHTLGAGTVGVTTMSSHVVSWAVTVTACDANVVVGSSQWQLLSVQCLVYLSCKYRP